MVAVEYIYSNKPIEVTTDIIANNIVDHLGAGKKVLLLLSGGSNISVAVKLFQKLSHKDLSELSVSLTDERYGQIGHKDENWQQLLDAGFNPGNALAYRPLNNGTIQQTDSMFNSWLESQIKSVDYIIGIFGVGSDGHTAGIKPLSPASSSTRLVTFFEGEDFKRVTISFNAIRKIDEAIVQASGSDKAGVLKELLTEDLPITQQPAQILKEVPKLTIISNNKEEDL